MLSSILLVSVLIADIKEKPEKNYGIKSEFNSHYMKFRSLISALKSSFRYMKEEDFIINSSLLLILYVIVNMQNKYSTSPLDILNKIADFCHCEDLEWCAIYPLRDINIFYSRLNFLRDNGYVLSLNNNNNNIIPSPKLNTSFCSDIKSELDPYISCFYYISDHVSIQ